MAGFSLQIKTTDAEFVASELIEMPSKIPQVFAGAFNKAIAKVKTDIARRLVEATTLKYGRVIKGTYVKKATRNRLVAGVMFQGRQIGAINFKKNKKRNRGYAFTFMKGDKPIHFRNAFLATGKSGNQQIFNRRRKDGSIPPRLPLKTIYGPSLWTIYRRNPQIEKAANEMANTIIRKELESQIDRVLKRAKK